MTEIDFLQQYIDAARESSNRTRQILLLMIIASILVFAAFWNSRANGWVNSRVTLARAAVDVLEAQHSVGSAPFDVSDIHDAPRLLVTLKEARDPLTSYMREQFTPDTLQLLGAHKPPSQPSPRLLEAVVYELNRLRKSRTLYARRGEFFPHALLRGETKELLAQQPPPQGDDLLRMNRLLLEDAFSYEIHFSRAEPIFSTNLDRERYERTKKYAKGRSLLQAKDTLFWAQRIRAEQLSQVQVPVLGISFDVNDLGMLGGFTFIVLLIWVNYSLWHQSTNIKLAFDFARELGKSGEPRLLYYTYQNLAMRQVLTIPPRPGSIESPERDRFKDLIQKASKLLYALPVVVLTVIVLHDWSTKDIGMGVNPQGTRIVLATGTLFLCFVGSLTALCFYMWRRTYNIWKEVAEEI